MKKLIYSTLAILPLSLFSQAAETNDDDDKVFELSPFEVMSESSDGYFASNSVSGSRINVALKELPMSLTVIPRELINDQAATQLIDILNYAPGVNTLRPDGWEANVNIRGFNEGGRPKRNGIRRYDIADSAVIERVEIIKGSNAIMYGQTQPGGTVNYMTKRAMVERDFGSASAQVGSNNFFRAEVDVNEAINDHHALRFVGAYQDNDVFRWFQHWTKELAYLTYAYRQGPWTVHVETEYYDVLNEANRRGLPQLRGEAWAFPDVPYEFDSYGDNFFYALKLNQYTSWVEFEVNDSLRLRAFGSLQDRWVSAMQTNDDRLLRANNTQIWRSIRLERWENDEYTIGADLLYEFDLLKGRHHLILGLESVVDAFSYNRYASYNPNGTSLLQRIPLTSRTAEEFRGPPLLVFDRSSDLPPFPQESEYFLRSQAFDQDNEFFGTYAILHSRFFNDRLFTLAGVRKDTFERKNMTTYLTGEDYVDPDPRLEKSDDFNPQIGASFALTNSLNIFGFYSRSTNPNYGADSDGTTYPPENGETKEAGIKFDIIKDRLSGTISGFQIDKENVVRTDLDGNRFANGAEAVEGVEMELFFTPIDNWQIMLGYQYLPTAEVVSNPESPEAEGYRLPNAPEHTFKVNTRYRFSEGTLEGSGIGFSYWYNTDVLWLSTVPEITDSSRWMADFFAFYDFEWQGFDWRAQLNVKNVFDREMRVERVNYNPREIFFTLKMNW
jgi:iron complex outermembrane receptor protein